MQVETLNPQVLNKFKEWYHSPLLWVRDNVDVTPSEQQVDALISVAGNKRTSIRSGHGTGKDACASWIILWFASTRPYAKVACTAPTARQLRDILWSELSKWLRKSQLKDEFVFQSEKIYNKRAKDEWWIRAISASVTSSPEEQAETLAGLHGDHLLIVIDEASGVPDPVYTTLEGALTQTDNRALMIGNMTKNSGYFYESHYHKEIRKLWNKLHWNSEESSNVDPGFCEYMAIKYGRDSNVYRVRVLGDAPFEDEKSLIPLAWAQQCIGNEIFVCEDDPLLLGVDVARFGDDKSIILPRRGLRIDPWETYRGMDTMSLAERAYASFLEQEADACFIDEIGVGAGVADWLRRHDPRRFIGVNVNTKVMELSGDKSAARKYDRLRDQLWWEVREKCRSAAYSFPDQKKPGEKESYGEELANELNSIYYDFTPTGAIKVESKKDMKKRGIASPNIADALCLTEAFYRTAHKRFGMKAKKKDRPLRPWERALQEQRYSNGQRNRWMVL